MKRMLLHAIEADAFMQGLGVSSKLNADWEFLTHLHEIGRRSADGWLAEHFDRLGTASTIDVQRTYL